MNGDRLAARKMLYEFYRLYNYWLEHGAGGRVFKRSYGLCSNLQNYACKVVGDQDIGMLAIGLMHYEFGEAGLNPTHPFDVKFTDYIADCKNKVVHLNQDRRQWVKDRLAGEPL